MGNIYFETILIDFVSKSVVTQNIFKSETKKNTVLLLVELNSNHMDPMYIETFYWHNG